jgi:hypothetical protein
VRPDPTLPVRTAGAYVILGSVLPFMVGPTRDGSRLGVVRLGGHREPSETPWQCAAREVQEEAALTITPLPPPATYWLRASDPPARMQAGPWPATGPDDVAPLLVVATDHLPTPGLSLMYLARAAGQPFPSAETQGLLLLRPDDVTQLVDGGVTLEAYLAMGGRALLRAALPPGLLLEPFLQLRALADLLHRHPELVANANAPFWDDEHG